MSRTYWSKFAAGTTASVVGDPDYRGLSLAWIYDLPDTEGPVTATINLDEWSEVELVPTPATIPDTAYVVVAGPVDKPYYALAMTEVEAAVKLSKEKLPIGYARILIERVMFPPQ